MPATAIAPHVACYKVDEGVVWQAALPAGTVAGFAVWHGLCVCHGAGPQVLFLQAGQWHAPHVAGAAVSTWVSPLFAESCSAAPARLLQGFQGVDYSTKGDRGSGPVQFEKDPVEADPFGLDQIISEASHLPPTHLAQLLPCCNLACS